MAIFKDRTGRGEVEYTKPVRSEDGTVLLLDGIGNEIAPITTEPTSTASELVFQLRGNSTGVADISVAKNTVNEISGTLTKRIENVTQNQKLKTFEFSGQVLTLSASVNNHNFSRAGLSDLSMKPTILPYDIQQTAQTHCVLSGWIYLESVSDDENSDGTADGSCVIESVNEADGKRSFGFIVSGLGELIFRYYDWGHAGGYLSSASDHYQQVKTIQRLEAKKWYHFTVFFGGYLADATGSEFGDTRAWNSGGLDSNHQLMGTMPAGGAQPQVQIYIDGVPKSVSEAGQISGNIADGVDRSLSEFPLVIGSGLGSEDTSPDRLQHNARFKGRLAELSYFKTFGISHAAQSLKVSKFTTWSERKTAIARALMSGKEHPTSGITNVSERLLLRDLDQNSTHPTVKRSGDQRRLGNHPIKFDDSRAQTLKGSTVQYPTKLVQGDNLIDTIYGGYFNGDLTLSHTASVESYDTFYRRNDQPSHEPFVESRLFIDDNSAFYQTGTLESVLPGFSKKLSSKDIVVIELENKSDCTLGPGHDQDLTSADADNVRLDFMAYYNKTGFFEKLPGLTLHTTASTEQNAIGLNNVRTGSCIGFVTPTTTFTSSTPSTFGVSPFPVDSTATQQLAIESMPDNYWGAFGRPCSTFAFPDDNRYVATGSNLISMSDYISEPFLVEKIVYEFPNVEVYLDSNGNVSDTTSGEGMAGFGGFVRFHGAAGVQKPGTYIVRQTQGLETLNCFLLRQFKHEVSGSRSFTYKEGPTTFTIKNTYGFNSSKGREIIDYQSRTFTGRLTLDSEENRPTFVGELQHNGTSATQTEIFSNVVESSTFTDAETELLRGYSLNNSTDLTIIKDSGGYDASVPKFNSSLKLFSTVKTCQKTGFAGSIKTTFPINIGAPADLFMTWEGGPSSISSDTSPRHFVKATSGRANPELGRICTLGGLNDNGVFIETDFFDATGTGPAPYLLLPEDNLIFGVQSNPNNMYAETSFSSVHLNNSIVLNSGTVKLSLFGSYLRNSQPQQFNLNQMLNNDIVHEAIGQELISDQFDIEPSAAFTGSYIDEIMSGSKTAPYNGFNASIHVNGKGADDFTNLARRVNGRTSEGTQGTTGSLRRNVVFVSSDKTEFDSFLFDLRGVFKLDERSGVNEGELPGLGRPSSFMLEDNETAIKTLIGDDPASVGVNDTNRGVRPNVDIGKAYYFARYHNITRVRQEQIGGSATIIQFGITGSSAFPSEPNVAGLVFNQDGANTVAPKSEYFLQHPRSSINAFEPLDAAKFLFGKSFELNGAFPAKFHVNNSYFVSTDSDLRGFRYGFSNISDKKPKNVFRRDQYGMLRDMLEMAPNTAYVDDASNNIEFAIEAKFFADDGSIASPDATSCSNLSTNLTSSAPFFDREIVEFEDPLIVRNRGPLNNKVVDITIEI